MAATILVIHPRIWFDKPCRQSYKRRINTLACHLLPPPSLLLIHPVPSVEHSSVIRTSVLTSTFVFKDQLLSRSLLMVSSCQLLTRLPTTCSIIASIVSSIDSNTLDALARSCRSVHDGLIQYRSVLLTLTLHCRNEGVPVNAEYRARASNWHSMRDTRSYNGKSGSCARDMVDECRKCGQVVCRVRLHLGVLRAACKKISSQAYRIHANDKMHRIAPSSHPRR